MGGRGAASACRGTCGALDLRREIAYKANSRLFF
jgi:hypothetical protein